MVVRKLSLSVLLFFFSISSKAELNAAPSYQFDEFKFSQILTWSRFKKNSISAFRGTPGTIFWTGAVLSGALILTQKDTSLKLQNHMVKNKPLGKWAEYGDLAGQMIPNAIYFGAYYYLASSRKSSSDLLKSIHMFESSLYSGLFTTLGKVVAHRQRPDKSNHKSFPSGHTTTAFAFAGTVGIQHGWPAAVGAYSLATLVGLSRINDNRHYLHDVVAGAAIGVAYSYSVASRNESADLAGQAFFLSPDIGTNAMLFNVVRSY